MNTRIHAKNSLSRCIFQDRLFANKLLLFLRKFKFSKQKFPTSKLVSDIKYHYPSSQNNNRFYLFNNQLDYVLANYFVESKTIKSNIIKFLFNPLIVLLIKKLSY